MGGGLLQLVAYGAQDVYLTGNPQITFFKVAYRRHTNFAMEAIEQTFNGAATFGSRVTCQITRNGDLINRIYLSAKLTNNNTEAAAGAGNENKGIALVPYFGLRLLKTIELDIGSQRIDKHYAEWLYIWNELSLPYGKRDGYYYMVGADRYNHSIYLGAKQSYTVNVPLEFWFCRNVGLALPLIALQYHEVKINIEFESAANLVDTGANYTDRAFSLVSSDGLALTNQGLRNSALGGGGASNLVISDISLCTNSTNLKSIRMNFNHPCKELVWVIKRSDATTYWNNFSDRTDNNVFLGENPTRSAKIQLNGNDRFAERDGSYFSLVQPYQHHDNTPDLFRKGINVYSFAIKPEEHQPSGTLNMSRIDTAILSLSSTVAGNVSIYTVNYNVLRILSGMGGLAYSN